MVRGFIDFGSASCCQSCMRSRTSLYSCYHRSAPNTPLISKHMVEANGICDPQANQRVRQRCIRNIPDGLQSWDVQLLLVKGVFEWMTWKIKVSPTISTRFLMVISVRRLSNPWAIWINDTQTLYDHDTKHCSFSSSAPPHETGLSIAVSHDERVRSSMAALRVTQYMTGCLAESAPLDSIHFVTSAENAVQIGLVPFYSSLEWWGNMERSLLPHILSFSQTPSGCFIHAHM